MQLASITEQGREHVALVAGPDIAELGKLAAWRAEVGAVSAGPPPPSSMLDLLDGGPEAVDVVKGLATFLAEADTDEGRDRRVLRPRSACTLLMPVPKPGRILCVGRNYSEHASEAGVEITAVPTLFFRHLSSMVADGEPIVRPVVSKQLDWEGELALVIGRPCRHVRREEAWDVVAALSIFNDGSIRDYQRMSAQWTPGKNFYRSGSFGPVLTPLEDVPDPDDLPLRTYVNDELMQDARTSQMIFDVSQIIEFVTRFTPLDPGDVIATGTPSGVGAFRDPPRFLQPGDVVRVEIDPVGTLENRVEDEARPS